MAKLRIAEKPLIAPEMGKSNAAAMTHTTDVVASPGKIITVAACAM